MEAIPFSPDLEEVRASLEENSEAQRRLLLRFKCIPRILAAVNWRMGGPLGEDELEDLAQAVVLSVWSKRSEYGGQAALESWVYSFCYHAFMNSFRSHMRDARMQSVEAAAGVAARSDPDYCHVHQALAELSADDRDVVRARHFDQLTFEKIGLLQGISTSTIKHRYYRGLDRLRILLVPSHCD